MRRNVAKEQDKELELRVIKDILKERPLRDRMPEIKERLARANAKKFQLADDGNTLLEGWTPGDGRTKVWRTVVPATLRETILWSYHDDSGHPEIERMYGTVRLRYQWRGMFADLQRHVQGCEKCTLRNTGQKKTKGKMGLFTTTSGQWDIVSVDVIKIKAPTTTDNQAVVMLIDKFSRWVEAKAVPGETGEEVAKFLRQVMEHHGTPLQLLSDRGKAFLSQVVDLINKWGAVKRKRTVGFRPQCNGSAENVQGSFVDMLAKAVDIRTDDWDAYLDEIIGDYNDQVNVATGVSPFMALYGHEKRKPVDEIGRASCRERV